MIKVESLKRHALLNCMVARSEDVILHRDAPVLTGGMVITRTIIDNIRIVWDSETEKYYFSIIDVIQVLTENPDYQTSRPDELPLPKQTDESDIVL